MGKNKSFKGTCTISKKLKPTCFKFKGHLSILNKNERVPSVSVLIALRKLLF